MSAADADAALDPTIAAAARQLAQAEFAAESATSALREAEAARDLVRSRLTDMEGQRRGIGARRAAGDQRDDDGQALALIAADTEALDGILAKKDADLVAARATAEQAVRALDAAHFGLSRLEDQAAERALAERMGQLDTLLREAIGQANDVARRLGRGRPAWSPTPQLMDRLTPLHLGRPWL